MCNKRTANVYSLMVNAKGEEEEEPIFATLSVDTLANYLHLIIQCDREVFYSKESLRQVSSPSLLRRCHFCRRLSSKAHRYNNSIIQFALHHRHINSFNFGVRDL